MARKRRNCVDVNGILLLDKPASMTSNAALQAAKSIFRACKAGHTGSLDPIATGLLPLCFGEATKVSQFLLNADKRYRTLFKLGESTTTYDSEGEVIERRSVTVGRRTIERTLCRFEGEIDQMPPMYSAIKRGGKSLYKLARKGIEIDRTPRRVVIHEIRYLSLHDGYLELAIHCSKGTYVRALAHDLGEALGCCAHVAGLRREAVGQLMVEDAVGLDALAQLQTHEDREALLLPVDVALSGLPDVHLTPLAAHYLCRGQPVSVRHSHRPGWVRLYAGPSRFLGMGQILDDGRVAPRRLLLGDPHTD
ncbi:MAG: tRNA pseudouridine(55) synthase TruB [Acidiferrobacterales bacterium]|nr:tRNA pseudouridine(55) synthase TruB [Acidiferrobacterales bacterium]